MAKHNTLALFLAILASLQLHLLDFSTGQDVVLKYDLYPPNKAPPACLPTTYWHLSTTFSFDDQSPLPNLVVKNESVHNGHELRMSCTSAHPLQWILDMPEVSLSKQSNFYLHPNDTEGSPDNRYYLCIGFGNLTSLSGSVRCESTLNGRVGAEIFIQNEGIQPRLGSHVGGDRTINFVVGSNNKHVIPCKISGGTFEKGALRVQLFENRSKMESESAATAVALSSQENYDPRLGFRLEKPINPDSTFQCETADDAMDFVDLFPFPEKDLRVHARIEYVKRKKPKEHESLGYLRCSVENSERGKVDLKMRILPCAKLPSCLRQNIAGFFVPYPPSQVKKYATEGEEFFNRSGIVISTTLPPSGLLYCGGVPEEVRTNYVEEIDYFFEGLNRRVYLASQDLPTEAVIALKPELPERDSNFTYSYTCTINTFVVFRAFNITLEFGPGNIKQFHVHTEPNPHENLETEIYNISGALKVTTQTASMVWINVSSDELTAVSCSAAYTHKMGWASERKSVYNNAKAKAAIARAPKSIEQRVGLTLDPASATAMSRTELIVTSVVLGVVALLAVLSAALLLFKYKRTKALTQGLTAEEIDQFRFGNSAAGTACTNNGNTAIPMATLNNEGLLDVNSLAFPPKFQIAANQLEIYRNDLLGEGEFAFCFRGKFNGTEVAVKMPKSSVQTEDFKNYLKEVKLMACIGQHPNIIGFYGAVIEKLDQKMAPVVMELSPKGNLKKFLQEQGHQILAEHGDQVLVSFCAQIAAGMEYLSHKNVTHGDLAARNVLVFEGFKVKITDFGLSKNLYESSFYSRRHQQVRLPWRWMSPESLEYLIFSVESDVWSFGVIAWEIFTLGQVPFGGLAWTTEFMKQLKEEGLRLPKPDRATDKIYGFLKLCWNLEPAYRPSFSDIRKFFVCLLQDNDYDLLPGEV